MEEAAPAWLHWPQPVIACKERIERNVALCLPLPKGTRADVTQA